MNRLSLILIAALSFASAAPLMAEGADRAQRSSKPAAIPVAKPPVAASTAVINLNTATSAQIATLPGIGPKTADLIVQYRTKNGAFKKIEEIMNVRGIGEKSFLKLKSRITVAPARTEAQ